MQLPPPWRRFVESFPEISTDSAAYNLISGAHSHRFEKALQMDNMEEWGADQVTKFAEFQYSNDKVLTANYEILGTYDGQTFRWADANHSIDAALSKRAQNFRDTYRDSLGFLASQDEFPLSIRDIDALLALAGRDNTVEFTFLGQSYDGRAIAMTLSGLNLKHTPPKQSLLGRVFKREKPVNLMSMLHDLLAGDIAKLQPNDKNLERIEKILDEAFQAYNHGGWEDVISLLDKARAHMGEHPADTLPAGWLYLCEGWTQLHLNRTDRAKDAFNIARRAISVPDYSSALLGQARSSSDKRSSKSFLVAGLIHDPDWSQKNLTAEELTCVKTILDEQENSRPDDALGSEALLKMALAEMCTLEIEAMRRSKAASRHRTESHIMCEEDMVAGKETAWQWRLYILKWMTPGRLPDIGSYSSNPDFTAEKLKSFSINIDGHSALAEATYENHGLEQNYEYHLKQAPFPLSEKTLWRIDEILSVWDHEKIKLH